MLDCPQFSGRQLSFLRPSHELAQTSANFIGKREFFGGQHTSTIPKPGDHNRPSKIPFGVGCGTPLTGERIHRELQSPSARRTARRGDLRLARRSRDHNRKLATPLQHRSIARFARRQAAGSRVLYPCAGRAGGCATQASQPPALAPRPTSNFHSKWTRHCGQSGFTFASP